MTIAAIPATVPPAIAPVFDLCPTLYPTDPGVDADVFEELPTENGGVNVGLVLGTGTWVARVLDG